MHLLQHRAFVASSDAEHHAIPAASINPLCWLPEQYVMARSLPNGGCAEGPA
jgi:hypothetical protein